MGQYYKVVILADVKYKKEIVRRWMMPNSYSKLMEHAYVDNAFVKSIEDMISPEGVFYMSRIIWAGDYAENEVDSESNLYNLVETTGAYYRRQLSSVS